MENLHSSSFGKNIIKDFYFIIHPYNYFLHRGWVYAQSKPFNNFFLPSVMTWQKKLNLNRSNKIMTAICIKWLVNMWTLIGKQYSSANWFIMQIKKINESKTFLRFTYRLARLENLMVFFFACYPVNVW